MTTLPEPTSLRDVFADARVRLAGSPTEALGELVTPRRVLGLARAARIRHRGAAWHLGVLLITADSVLATGEIVRARHEAPRGFTAESQRRRAELAAAASRGGFADGVTVHIGWREIDLDAVESGGHGSASGPVALLDGVPRVRWGAGTGSVALTAYLDERIALLTDPPEGAT